ncbi:hypothetical protein ACQKLX_10055 [Bosea sp. NPDC003192]|uniref:hypothetical protein n=1 Tax=Bosea sp. NPDC003192 TaxID=3390551 RepID=UPI003D05B646
MSRMIGESDRIVRRGNHLPVLKAKRQDKNSGCGKAEPKDGQNALHADATLRTTPARKTARLRCIRRFRRDLSNGR